MLSIPNKATKVKKKKKGLQQQQQRMDKWRFFFGLAQFRNNYVCLNYSSILACSYINLLIQHLFLGQ